MSERKKTRTKKKKKITPEVNSYKTKSGLQK